MHEDANWAQLSPDGDFTPEFGDVDGDGDEEALFVIDCNVGEGGVILFAVALDDKGAPYTLGVVTTAGERGAVQGKAWEVRDGIVRLKVNATWETYRWNGSAFVRQR